MLPVGLEDIRSSYTSQDVKQHYDESPSVCKLSTNEHASVEQIHSVVVQSVMQTLLTVHN